MKNSPVAMRYDEVIDRESAYEILEKKEAKAAEAAAKAAEEDEKAKKEAAKKTQRRSSSRRMTTSERAVNEVSRAATRRVIDYVFRGILGGRSR